MPVDRWSLLVFLRLTKALRSRAHGPSRTSHTRERLYDSLIKPLKSGQWQARIGFVSAYFRDHTIGKLNLPRLRHVDRNQFHVTTILATQEIDPVSKGFQESSDDFVILPRGLPQAIQTLRQLKLDV